MTRESEWGPVELDALLEAVCEEAASPEQLARLEALTLADADARRHCVAYLQTQAELLHQLGGIHSLGEELPGLPARVFEAVATRPAPVARTRRLSRWAWLPWAVAAAACLVAVVTNLPTARRVLVATLRGGSAGSPGTSVSGGTKAPRKVVRRTVAVLTRAIDVRWGPTTLPTDLGSALPTGRLRLESGLAQVEFYGGAIVVVEGPADLELLAADRALCRRGKVRVRAPLHANNFTLLTPGAEVVDLGTEFGVKVGEAGDSEVQVFEGLVELQRRQTPDGPIPARRLRQGQGVHVEVDGGERTATVEPDTFVSARELERRSSAEGQERYRSWVERSRRLQTDRRLVLYYSFEGQQRWERMLLDQVEGRDGSLDGGIVGGQWTEGRWPGKGALELKRPSDRVRVHFTGDYPALTLLTWLRVDGLDGHSKTSLLSSDAWGQGGQIHWEILGDGRLVLVIHGVLHHESRVIGLSPGGFGLWMQLAATVGADGVVRQYANGHKLGEARVGTRVRIRPGWAEVGNWTPDPTDADIQRNLNGRIDEFAIFDRALDPLEIEELYDVGRPYL